MTILSTMLIEAIAVYSTMSSLYSDWLWAGRPRHQSSAPVYSPIFASLYLPEAHPASYPTDIEASFTMAKADHSPATTAEVLETWFCTYTPSYVIMT
jgi:hypothetical protein